MALQLFEPNYREHLPEVPALKRASDARLSTCAEQVKALAQQIEAVA